MVALAQRARVHQDPAALLASELDSQAGLRRELLVDLPAGQPAELELQLAEQCRYTSTLDVHVHVRGLELRAWLRSDGLRDDALHKPLNQTQALAGVRMAVRLYHDVRLAEVIAFSGKRSALASYEYPNEVMFQPDEKAQQNRFLAEWLSHGLSHGLASHGESSNAAAFYVQH
ncbi:MAG: DUF1249 domain-containing protein [Gammaproteobacteria bacterium]|nr:DUF1249 domain-containing protein [Gammaproteobacteria bacterium]